MASDTLNDCQLSMSVEDCPLPETFCIDLDRKYSLTEFISHLDINFDVQLLEVLNQQYDLNNFTGVIDARIVVVIKHRSSEENKASEEEKSDTVLQSDTISKIQTTVAIQNVVYKDKNNEEVGSDHEYESDDEDTEDIYDENGFMGDDLKVHEECENLNNSEKEKFRLINTTNETARVSKPLCDQCGQVFHQQRTYIRHMLSAHGEIIETTGSLKPFVCSKCNLEFPARHSLQKHEMEHKGYYFKCSRCKPGAALKFPTYGQLRTHYLKVHMVMKCKHCSEVSYGRLNYNEHVNNTHSEHKAERNSKGELKKYTCSTCHNVFYHANKYEEHLMFQRNGMCFVCPICDKSMRNRKCLKYHMTTHGVGKRKQCELCDRTFAQNSALVQHMRINHPDKLPAKYRGNIACELCGKVFRNRGHLVQHKQTAHEDVMRRCAKCKRVFTSAAALSNHTHHCT